MIVLRDGSPFPPSFHGSVIALGNFDGLHSGHAHVIAETLRIARLREKPAALLTFEPHPRRLFRPDLPPLRLLTLSEKLRRLRHMQLDMVRLIRFTRAFSEMPADAFAGEVLHRQMRVSHVVTGDDFIFGHNRQGDVGFLRAQAERHGFGFTACAAVTEGGERCSSSRIRALLAQGKVGEASGLMGRPYSITGRVQRGDARGRQLGFPTANIVPAHLFTPANGVYAVRARFEGQTREGVANLGIRPTFGSNGIRLEVHLLDWSGDLYGRKMEVEYVHYIRAEQAFSGIDALKRQIEQDAKEARAILRLAK